VTPDRTLPGMFGVVGSGDTSGYGRLARTTAQRAGSPRPYGSYFDELVDTLASAVGSETFGIAVERVTVHRGQLTITVARRYICEIAQILRDDPGLRFELCAGVSGVHFPAETGAQLHAIYPLMSITHNRRMHLEVTAPEDDPHIPSLYAIYPTCDWHERETYDFFGIVFDGHPALTRIQMPDDWVGHPQRKDQPLGGIPVQYHGVQVPPPDQRRAYH
jgi:NADH-quinone oxidoreductase subunit C